MQDFLLKTSFLPRLNAGLCDAVLKRHDSRAVLAALDRANLFIVPLDNRREWYRYHPLFSDLLRPRLSEAIEDAELIKTNSATGEVAGRHFRVYFKFGAKLLQHANHM